MWGRFKERRTRAGIDGGQRVCMCMYVCVCVVGEKKKKKKKRGEEHGKKTKK